MNQKFDKRGSNFSEALVNTGSEFTDSSLVSYNNPLRNNDSQTESSSPLYRDSNTSTDLSYSSHNVVAIGSVTNTDDTIHVNYDDDLEYENLELNFDDLYVDSEAEEEFFVQQPSPLVTQYEKPDPRSTTRQHTFPSLTPPSAVSSCYSSNTESCYGDNDDLGDENYIDETGYYQIESVVSNRAVGPSVALNDRKYDEIIFGNESNKPDRYQNPSGTSSNHQIGFNDEINEETYILGTLIIRVVAARGLVSVQDYYEKSQSHSYGRSSNINYENDSQHHRHRNNLRRRDKKKQGGFFSKEMNDYVGTNPYVSVRFSTLVENENDDNDCDGRTKGQRYNLTNGRHLLTRPQVQRTSTIYNSCHPVWPRGENMYMDVVHPMPLLPQQQYQFRSKSSLGADIDEGEVKSSLPRSDSSTVEKSKSDIHPGDPPSKPPSLDTNATTRQGTVPRKVSNKKRVDGCGMQSFSEMRRSTLTPVVSCAVFHASTSSGQKSNMLGSEDDALEKQKKANISKKDFDNGDSDDLFLGMAVLDVTPLLTGKVVSIDEWIPLSGGLLLPDGGSGNSNKKHQRQHTLSMVRIICEYEPTDAQPQKGDYIQFTQFCHKADLYPVPILNHSMFKVEEVFDDRTNDDNDYILISTLPPSTAHSGTSRSSDAWRSTFLVHRYMLIMCKEREPTIMEACRDEIISVSERISASPLVSVVNETVNVRVPEDGIVSVGKEVVQSAVSALFTRWLQKDSGLETFLNDLNYVTNWDGQHSFVAQSTGMSPTANNVLNASSEDNWVHGSSDGDCASKNTFNSTTNFTETMSVSQSNKQATNVTLPNMPPCPITGEPMRDPVVAADGHTYERVAIARWLQNNDRSPLTGSVLEHKTLVPNYMLLSSLQELASTTSHDETSNAPKQNVATAKVEPLGESEGRTGGDSLDSSSRQSRVLSNSSRDGDDDDKEPTDIDIGT